MRRRSVVQGLGVLATALVWPGSARATLVTGLTLPQLVTRSRHVVVVRALESASSEVQLGGRRTVVTDTQVEVSDALHGAEPSRLLTVRTLGGRIGNRGELVLGQPRLATGSRDVAFLTTDADGRCWFVGMAQGHYPLWFGGGAEPLLQRSKNLPEIRQFGGSAVKALHGLALADARRSIREAGAE